VGRAVAGFGAAGRLWLALGCLAIAGAADTTSVAFRTTIVQTAIPDQLRGWITAADYVVGYGGPQIGSLESGAAGSLASPAISAVSGGLATVVGAVVIGLALPAFARYRGQGEPGGDGAAGAAPAQATA
jgi:hypothetical protein